MKPFAQKMNRLGTENAFEVLAQVNKLKAEGKNIVSFCIGEPDFDTPKNIKESAKKALDDGYTHYSPSAGLAEVRKVFAGYISRTRKIDVSPDEIVITPGAKPIIFFGILACVEEGDEVIYPSPGYPIYESMINYAGAKAVPMPLLEEKEFNFNVDELEKKITPKTKMIIINTPHNPCGGVIPKEDLRRIAEIAVKNDLWVMSDEIYSRIVYDGEFQSIIQFPGMKERTILIDGHSKAYAMTGWRLGYGVMNKDLAFWIARFMTNSSACTSTFVQIAGAEAYNGSQEDVSKMVQEFKERRDLIVDGLNLIEGIKCLRPHGAFYVFPNVTDVCRKFGFKDAEQLQQYLLHEAGVAVLTRTCFGERNENEKEEYLRFSYATSKDIIKEGLKRVGEALADKEKINKFLNK